LKPNLIIRADGGASIGMGHVIRCLALGNMLKNDFNITFAIQTPTESIVKNIHTVTETIIHLPQTNDYATDAIHFTEFLNSSDIVLLDGYHFKTDYQKKIKEKGCKLVCIDDLHDWHFVADAIINHAEGINESMYSAEKYTKFYFGLKYALLRKIFLESTVTKKISSIKKVFISMGAADMNNLTQKFVEALVETKGIEEIHLMLGAINPNLNSIDALIEKNKRITITKHFNITAEELAEWIKKCDVVICPASSISIESCAIGTGLISGYSATNQLGILEGLIKNKAAISIGDMNTISVSQIKTKLEELTNHPEQFNNLIENQKKMIDGKSPERFVELFKNLIPEKIHFRFAKESDMELYYNWSNDPLVRSNSFNQNPVEHENHVKWFLAKLNSKECHFYLFLNEENKPVGQVRIDSNEKETVIGISIDEAFRGRSIGTEMLKKSTADYLHKHSSKNIVAYIKQENTASYNIFKKAGFSNEEIVTEQGHRSYKLYKKVN
jgi:UDP-2,4-diacetamido-2,4,6-trideoxy-beta-L-altropyranose hydrolase